MIKSIFFVKKLTAAEVGNTRTHEKYVRLPNDFDYDAFFPGMAKTVDGVIQVEFEASNMTVGHEEDSSVALRFAYYVSSNNEKRIPSLGSFFSSNGVQEDDIVTLESRTELGVTKFFITFTKSSLASVSPAAFTYSIVRSSVKPKSIEDPLQKIVYGAPGTGKSFGTDGEIKKVYPTKADEREYVFRTTFHPDSDYSTFVGCYKPTMANAIEISSPGELISKLTEIKNTGTSYPCHKFATLYWESLKDLSATEIKSILTSCGFTESMNVEILKGVAIGQYMANKADSKKITYSFTPQSFTKAYLAAWNALLNKETLTDKDGKEFIKPVFLVIEEINRGNCAQIFGDLFQLLDRDKNGFSTYPIKPDTDLGDYIKEELKGLGSAEYDSVVKGEELILPNNLYIWATMNTSDQSLFPIDSAFKRRWDWKYVPIKYDNDNWKVELEDGSWCEWKELQQTLNDLIYDATESEDKMLGDWFVRADDKNKISQDVLVGKIIFYLWNDVAKVDAGKLFDVEVEKRGRKRKVIFSDFYNVEGETDMGIVKEWLTKIGVTIYEKETTSDDSDDSDDDSGSSASTSTKPEYIRILEKIEAKCKEQSIDYNIGGNSMNIKLGNYALSNLRVVVSLDNTGTPNADVKLWISSSSAKSIDTRDTLRAIGAGEFFEDMKKESDKLSCEEIGKEYPDSESRTRGWRLTNKAITFEEANAADEAEWIFEKVQRIRARFATALD